MANNGSAKLKYQVHFPTQKYESCDARAVHSPSHLLPRLELQLQAGDVPLECGFVPSRTWQETVVDVQGQQGVEIVPFWHFFSQPDFI